jgi:hypothetical protein
MSIPVIVDPASDTSQSGLVTIGQDGEGMAAWRGQWRRETGPPFDTPQGAWWSWAAVYPDITLAPLSVYQDFYIYYKLVSETGSPSYFGGSAAFGVWHNLGISRNVIIEDDATPNKQSVYGTYMIYSPSGTPVGDPSVAPPAGTVFMGQITASIGNIF